MYNTQQKQTCHRRVFFLSLYFICTYLSLFSWLWLFSLLYNTHNTIIHTPGGIRTRNPSKRTATNLLLTLLYIIFENCAFCENVKKYGGAKQAIDDNIVRHMRFACWITEATDTFSVCNIYYLSTARIVTRMCLNITWHVYCLSCFRIL
jgi:hypothetical protein